MSLTELTTQLDSLRTAYSSDLDRETRKFSAALDAYFTSISTDKFDEGSFETTQASIFFNGALDLLIAATTKGLKPDSLPFTSLAYYLARAVESYFNGDNLSNEAKRKRAGVLTAINDKVKEIPNIYAINELRTALIKAEEALRPATSLKPTTAAAMASTAEMLAVKTNVAAVKAAAWLAAAGTALAQFAATPPSGREASVAAAAVAPAPAAGGAGAASTDARTESAAEKNLEARIEEAVQAYQKGSFSSVALKRLIETVISEVSSSFNTGIWTEKYLGFNFEEMKNNINPLIKSTLLYTKLLQNYLSPTDVLRLWAKPIEIINTYLLKDPRRFDHEDRDGNKRRALIEAIKGQLNFFQDSFLDNQYNILIAKIALLRGKIDSMYPVKSLAEHATEVGAALAAATHESSTRSAAAAAAAATATTIMLLRAQAAATAAAGRLMPPKAEELATPLADPRAAAAAADAGLTVTVAMADTRTGGDAALSADSAAAGGLTVATAGLPPVSPRAPSADASLRVATPSFRAAVEAALAAEAAAQAHPAAPLAPPAGRVEATPSLRDTAATAAPDSARKALIDEITRIKISLEANIDYRGAWGFFSTLFLYEPIFNPDGRKEIKIHFLGIWLAKLEEGLSPSDALNQAWKAIPPDQRERITIGSTSRVRVLVKKIGLTLATPTQGPAIPPRP